MNRRGSAALWAVSLCIFVAAPAAAAQPKKKSPESAPKAEEILSQLKRQHPRLLVDGQGFEDLKARVGQDATLRKWNEQLRQDAEKLLKAPLPKHVLPDGLRLLSTSRSVLDRTYTLALAFRLHGDRRFADRLWQEVETVAKFPDFNPKHFLDTAEMTHALAVAYDWLYDTWTEPQRKTIRTAMIEMGLKPGLAVYRKKGGWPQSVHNWNQVCNGGMTLGALALGDEEPELAGAILAHAIASLPRAMASYAPDGAWGEGPGYWAYATSYNVYMLAGLDSALGTDFGLSKIEGFDKTGLFPLYTTGPTGLAFNYEDSGDRVGRSDCLFWLDRRFDLPACAWFASQGRGTPRSIVWYRKPGLDPAAAGLPLDKYWRGVEVATLRSAWNDPKAVFAGIQAGTNRVNHNHLDLGSFVLDALGQRWAVDLGADDYNLPGYFGRQRYTYYRLRAESHNTLVLNPDQGPDQNEKADCKIVRFDSQPEKTTVLADLTDAYAKHARRVERGLALLGRRDVLVQDEVEADKPADLWWFVHTGAEVTLAADGRSAMLQQKGEKLAVRLLAPAEARFEVRPAEPLPTSPNPQGQKNNQAFRKLAIHLPGVTRLQLAVLFAPGEGERKVEVKPLAQW
jgi:hypothetical protein